METTTGQSSYNQLIDAWNSRDALAFANLFSDDSICIGFDGSEMFGRQEILSSLSNIFKDHPTAKYVSIIRETKMLSDNTVLVRAHVGMLPPDASRIASDRNAIQIMIARVENSSTQIILFQNTPAQFHGRPALQEKLTLDLQKVAEQSLLAKV
jgi:uncharacterized protein (TIGR02246 family)